MKFLHTADLHIGKNIYEFSMLEDQKHILQEILDIARKEQVRAILLAGDIYDRSVPSTEAVELLEWFLLNALQTTAVCMISGNHDSAERLSFGASLLEKSGLYIAGGSECKEVLFQNEQESMGIHLLPFVKPAVIETSDSEQAVRKQLEQFKANWANADRHILVTHFFVCAEGKEPELSDSEVKGFVGGLDQVDASVFAEYDYVALGHIHKPQCMKRGQVYYSGSPLSYSFSECNTSEAAASKGVNIIELTKEGETKIYRKVLHPKRKMRIMEGSLSELLTNAAEDENGREDYIQAILTDKDELIDPIGSLRSVYPNTMQIILKKRLNEGNMPAFYGFKSTMKSIEELFSQFYETLSGEVLDESRAQIVKEIAGEIEEKSI